MTLRSIPAVLLTGLLAVAGAACDVHVGDNGVSLDVASGKATQDWSRTYTVAANGSFVIENTNGSIDVEPSPGAQVEVKATIQARAGSEEEAQDLLKKVEIKEEASASEVRLVTTLAPGTGLGLRSVNVEYHLNVPPGLRVNVKTQNGGVVLRNVNGMLTATSTNGGIRGVNISGAVSAHTVNGGITLDVAHATGPIEAAVVNGGIGLDLPAGINADVEARVVNGGVAVLNGLTIATAEQTRNSLRGTLGTGGTKVTASTVNGGVRLGLRKATPTSTN
jgi:DUF4097 and DUF4098 domain-containing protein YvlB